MKKALLSACILLGFVADTTVVQAEEPAYVLVFSDEFNQPNGSQPDPAKWSVPPRANSIWARWISKSRRVAYIKNGALVCRAIPNKYEPSDTAKMLTGAVYTKDKFEFQYGKVEVRMKTNRKRGNFPAAWMGKTHKQRPDQYGEIDIVEVFSNNQRAHHTIHSQLTTAVPRHGQKNTFNEAVDVTRWHVYGIEWTPTYVTWTVDGKTVGTFPKSRDAALLAQGQWTFDYPFFLLLNQSVGDGRYENLPYPNTKQTFETRFDWIRVYQRKP